jgi:hypothetical protein
MYEIENNCTTGPPAARGSFPQQLGVVPQHADLLKLAHEAGHEAELVVRTTANHVPYKTHGHIIPRRSSH